MAHWRITTFPYEARIERKRGNSADPGAILSLTSEISCKIVALIRNVIDHSMSLTPVNNFHNAHASLVLSYVKFDR